MKAINKTKEIRHSFHIDSELFFSFRFSPTILIASVLSPLVNTTARSRGTNDKHPKGPGKNNSGTSLTFNLTYSSLKNVCFSRYQHSFLRETCRLLPVWGKTNVRRYHSITTELISHRIHFGPNSCSHLARSVRPLARPLALSLPSWLIPAQFVHVPSTIESLMKKSRENPPSDKIGQKRRRQTLFISDLSSDLEHASHVLEIEMASKTFIFSQISPHISDIL